MGVPAGELELGVLPGPEPEPEFGGEVGEVALELGPEPDAKLGFEPELGAVLGFGPAPDVEVGSEPAPVPPAGMN